MRKKIDARRYDLCILSLSPAGSFVWMYRPIDPHLCVSVFFGRRIRVAPLVGDSTTLLQELKFADPKTLKLMENGSREDEDTLLVIIVVEN